MYWALVLMVLVLRCCAAQNTGADALHSMLSSLTHNRDVQSLAYCRVSTQDLLATAEATANRVLQGVCNPRELNERLATLERQMSDQLTVLKTMVLSVEDQLRAQDKNLKNHNLRIRQLLQNRGEPSGGDQRAMDFYDQDYDPQDDQDDQDYQLPEEEEFLVEEQDSPRQREIGLYNSTMHQEEGWRVFTYYWRVKDINYKMRNWGWRRSLRSESFYIFQNGYRMYMRIYPNNRGENVYVHVGLTLGDYDANLEWPFQLKHRIQILDHGSPSEDIVSRVWNPSQLCSGWHWRRPQQGDNYECVGLGFPHSLVRTRNYVNRDSIVVKLTVFLAQ